ncbi:MAG: hypothetical protein IKD18_06290, partial [Clostridia bacterium]|nr:hypothetical protein [Clostridia bacterium]
WSSPAVSVEVRSGTFRERVTELPLFSSAQSRGKSTLITKEEAFEPRKVTVETASLSWMEEAKKEETKEKTETVNAEKTEVFTSSCPPETKAELPVYSATLEIKAEAPVQEQAEEAEQLMLEGMAEEEKADHPLGQGVLRGVVFNAYLLYESGDAVYIIDKHAAHERILYEALKRDHKTGSVQFFMEPQILNLTPTEAACISEHLTELGEAGFPMEEFGESSFLLRGIPLEFITLSEKEIVGMLEQAAREMSLGGKARGAGDKKFDRTLYSMACKAAVKAGIPSTQSDHEWLVEKLKEIDNITVCPHGRPVLVPMTKKEFENLFLRT